MASVKKTASGKSSSVRLVAVELLVSLYKNNGSLSSLLPAAQTRIDPDSNALLQEFVYGVSRWYFQLEAELKPLMNKPLRNKDIDVKILLILGLYQMQHMRIADHAVLNETVAVAQELRKNWARGLVNAVLRNFQRRRAAGESGAFLELGKLASEVAEFSHPEWMIQKLKLDWPSQWQGILKASNQRPPLGLRVNLSKIALLDYQKRLSADSMEAQTVTAIDTALRLEKAVPVAFLPGFFDGMASVQDGSAQLAVQILAKHISAQAVVARQLEASKESQGTSLKVGRTTPLILDACAAPGGKSCHLLESLPSAKVLALDVSQDRLERITENLQRLELQDRAAMLCGDAADPESWWDGVEFDAMLLDVPCTGSGVTRRQPDIRLMRRETDLESLLETQREILNACWKLLKPGGVMLYATCSVFKQENQLQMKHFLSTFSDAHEIDVSTVIEGLPGQSCEHAGWQILTGDEGLDGFYYCLVEKHA